MNRTEAKELLPVITAFEQGADVQYRKPYGSDWVDTDEPTFNARLKWRIKPKLKTCVRWCFAVFFPDGSFSTRECKTEGSAEEMRAEILVGWHDAAFSSIVRVEFLEEQT